MRAVVVGEGHEIVKDQEPGVAGVVEAAGAAAGRVLAAKVEQGLGRSREENVMAREGGLVGGCFGRFIVLPRSWEGCAGRSTGTGGGSAGRRRAGRDGKRWPWPPRP